MKENFDDNLFDIPALIKASLNANFYRALSGIPIVSEEEIVELVKEVLKNTQNVYKEAKAHVLTAIQISSKKADEVFSGEEAARFALKCMLMGIYLERAGKWSEQQKPAHE